MVVPASTVAALAEHPGLTLPPVTAGDWSAPGPLIAIVGFVAGACLLALGRAGAMLVAIAVSALLAMQTGHMAWTGAIVAWPRFDTVFQADVRAALDWRLVPLLFSLVLVDFFDTVGTVTAIGEAAGLTGRDGMMPRLKQILAIDAIGGDDRRRQRGELRDVLRRVGGGRRRRRTHRPALGVRRAAVPGVDGPGADRRRGAGGGHGAGPDPDRAADVPRHRPHRRRPARHGAPGVPHRDHGAADVPDLARHRRRLHRLRRHQGAERAHPRRAPADGGLGRHLRPLFRAGVVCAARPQRAARQPFERAPAVRRRWARRRRRTRAALLRRRSGRPSATGSRCRAARSSTGSPACSASRGSAASRRRTRRASRRRGRSCRPGGRRGSCRSRTAGRAPSTRPRASGPSSARRRAARAPACRRPCRAAS